MKMDTRIEINKQWIKDELQNSSDLTFKEIPYNGSTCMIVYLVTLVDTSIINEHILRPMLDSSGGSLQSDISIIGKDESDQLDIIIHAIITGKTAVQQDGSAHFLLLSSESHKDRTVDLTVNERVIRGSKQAFVELFETNINLIRTYVSSPKLAITYYEMGETAKTRVAVAYLKDSCDPALIDELHKRLMHHSHEDIEIRLGFIKRVVQDDPFSFLPLMMVTERPDRVKAFLVEGKIAIIVQDMADVIILPVSFWSFFQSTDDYNMSWAFGSLLRLLRLACFVLTLVLPALYISISTFIPYFIPTEIALTLQSALQYIAMPPIIEMLFMLLTLEIIREASIRLASPIGQTLGVVGGIILGTAVVQSNLVSTMAIIIASFTGLASFVIPSYEMNLSIRLMTYMVIFSAQLFGFVGLICCILILIIHVSRMKTLGQPYYQAAFPFIDSMRDTLYRPPSRNLVKRSRKQPSTK